MRSEGKVGTKNHLSSWTFVCLSVDPAEPLESFSTVHRHITTADNSNGHLQEDLPVRTASIGTYRAENRYPTFHAQTALTWVSQVYRQTDVAGLVHILICNPHVISCRTCHAPTGNPLLPSLPLSSDVWPHPSPLQEATCVGQHFALSCRIQSSHRRGTSCVTPRAGNPGGPKVNFRVNSHLPKVEKD